MKIILISVIVCLVSGTANAGTKMSYVMAKCEDYTTNFSEYVECVKNTYATEGNDPDGEAVRAFYSYLDEITERYALGAVTKTQAKIETHQAYSLTISAHNKELTRELDARRPIYIRKW